MTRLTPTPRSEALGAVQRRPTDDARHNAVAAQEYTTADSLGIVKRLYHLLVIALVEGTLLDLHASPALACSECCYPYCRCQERE